MLLSPANDVLHGDTSAQTHACCGPTCQRRPLLLRSACFLRLRRGSRAYICRTWRMKRFVPCTHSDEALDSGGSRLWILRGLHTIKNRVPVRAIERLEKSSCPCTSRKSLGEIRGHARRARSVVCPLPPSITLGSRNRSETRSLHRACGDQRLRLRAVDLRPGAVCRARAEALQPCICVERTLLAINPSPCERDAEGLCVGGRLLRPFLRDAKPDPPRATVIRPEPLGPLPDARELQDRFHSFRFRSVPLFHR